VGEPEPEILVILEATAPGVPPTNIIRSLRAFGSVVGRLPPRLVLLAAPGEQAVDVAMVPGVAGAFTEEVPPEILATFSETERLFVDAWMARHAPQPPPPGDGLPWDSPGRLPPDLPPPPPGDGLPWDSPGRLPPDLPPTSPCTPGAGSPSR
jgi:hypothetical protein